MRANEGGKMANILDYFDEYGAVGFAEKGFSAADALVLCQLAYLDLADVVPEGGVGVSVADASRRYFRLHDAEEIYGAAGFMPQLTPFVLQKMAAGRRFGEARLSRFEEHFDAAAHCQFAAYTAELGDGSAFVAFRGTDDTLVGWREDFLLGAGTVPAQLDALAYLGRVGEELGGKLLRVGGHSKGGNLAVYASAKCDVRVQGRILGVFDCDGPGFVKEVLGRRDLAPIRKRMQRIVPEYCVVGSLFHRGKPDLVVKSSETGISQHSALSWQIEGGEFVRAEKVCAEARRVDGVLAMWMGGVGDRGDRDEFVNAAFDALESVGLRSFTELTDINPAQLRKLIAATSRLDARNRRIVEELLVALVGNGVEEAVKPLVKHAGAIGGKRTTGEEDVNGSNGAGDTDAGADGPGFADEPSDETGFEPSIKEMNVWRRRAAMNRRRMDAWALTNKLATNAKIRGIVLLVGGIALMGSADSVHPLVPIAIMVACAVHAATLLVRYVREKRQGGADLVDVAVGSVLGIAAIAFLVFQGALTVTFNLLVGGAALLYGIYLLRAAVRTRAQEGRVPVVDWLWCAAALVLGMVVLLNPSQVIGPVSFAMGVFAALQGLMDLARAFDVEARVRE